MKITEELRKQIESAENTVIIADSTIIAEGRAEEVIANLVSSGLGLAEKCGINTVDFLKDLYEHEIKTKGGTENGSTEQLN